MGIVSARQAGRAPVVIVMALVGLLALGAAGTGAADPGDARLIEVKVGLESMSKSDRDTLWRRVEEYATVDALQEFCGRKLNLQRRTWAAVSACVEVKSLRKVASVFRSKKAEYLKGWETNYPDDEKKKAICDTWKPKLVEYAGLIETHISEARSLCNACIFC